MNLMNYNIEIKSNISLVIPPFLTDTKSRIRVK